MLGHVVGLILGKVKYRVGFDDISKSWVLCDVEVCDSMPQN